MRDFLLLTIHLIVTLAKLLRPGGVKAVAAESLVLKRQLTISNQTRSWLGSIAMHGKTIATVCFKSLVWLESRIRNLHLPEAQYDRHGPARGQPAFELG